MQTRGLGGALRLTHLMSSWRTHGTAEKHWAKLNTASRDKRFSLRLGNHRRGVGRGPSLVSSDKTESTLCVVRAQGRRGLSPRPDDDETH